VLNLPPNTILLPGHGPTTTVAQELQHNPFLASAGAPMSFIGTQG